ncbi:MAG: cupredoxin domain-containing protein [Actinomycetota bacterium]|nr:cupredoxin domain-containing protein [Actinomycetota bacterium]
MLNLASRVLLALTGLAAVVAGAYSVAGGERTGVVLLSSLAAAALVGALSTAGNAVVDVAPPVADDAPPPARTAVSAAVPRGSAWPAAAAVSVSVLAVGAAVGVPVVLGGLFVALVTTAGWFSRAWSEHPSWTRPVRKRVSSRLLAPVGLPAGGFLLAAVIAVSLSRVLLAISKEAATVVGLVVAVSILVACAWVASRPRLGSSVLVALSVLAAASVLGAGIAGAIGGERHFEAHEHEEKPLTISAQDLKFSEDTIAVPAGKDVILEFVNRDEVFHNVAVYDGTGPDAKPVFNGEGFPGDGERSYEFHAPPPGTYTFVCDFHPNMQGRFLSEGQS